MPTYIDSSDLMVTQVPVNELELSMTAQEYRTLF